MLADKTGVLIATSARYGALLAGCSRETIATLIEYGERIGVAAVVFWASQILSYVMVFSFEPFYDFYADQPVRLFGLSPLTDQKLAGVVMMVEQTLTIGIAVVVLIRMSRARSERTGWELTP